MVEMMMDVIVMNDDYELVIEMEKIMMVKATWWKALVWYPSDSQALCTEVQGSATEIIANNEKQMIKWSIVKSKEHANKAQNDGQEHDQREKL